MANRPANTPFSAILTARLARRDFLKGSLATAVAAALPSVGCTTAPAAGPVPIGFTAIPPSTDDALKVVTTLGETWFVIAAAIVLVVAERLQGDRIRWIAAYLAFVIVGQNVLTRTIKELADRVRPDLNPIAETLGPSFPSGHTTGAAAWRCLHLSTMSPPAARPPATPIRPGTGCSASSTSSSASNASTER